MLHKVKNMRKHNGKTTAKHNSITQHLLEFDNLIVKFKPLSSTRLLAGHSKNHCSRSGSCIDFFMVMLLHLTRV